VTKEVMNQSGALGHAAGSTVSAGAFTIKSVPSSKVKAEGSGVYRGPLTYSFTGGNAEGFVDASVLTSVDQTIDPTAVKVNEKGQYVIRVGDSGTMACIGTIDPTPPAPPYVGPVAGAVVEVSDPGQTKMKAN
jgi:hypothetical protein